MSYHMFTMNNLLYYYNSPLFSLYAFPKYSVLTYKNHSVCYCANLWFTVIMHGHVHCIF